MGSGDNELRASDEENIFNLQSMFITKCLNDPTGNSSNLIDVIFLFEDLSMISYDRINLTYTEAKQMFGSDQINESVIVIGNKINICGYERSKKKSDRVRDRCNQLGLKYVEFETSWSEGELSYEEIQAQMDRLMPLVKECKPFDLRSTSDIIESIKQSALEKQRKAPKIKQYTQVTYQEQTLRPYDSTEKYMDKEWGKVGEGGRPFLGIIGPRKKIYGWIPVEKERACQRYEPTTETRTKNVETFVTPDIRPFQQEALKEHLANLKIATI